MLDFLTVATVLNLSTFLVSVAVELLPDGDCERSRLSGLLESPREGKLIESISRTVIDSVVGYSRPLSPVWLTSSSHNGH